MKKITRCRFPKSVKGQGFVELALVLPVLLIMVAGIIDLSRLYFTYNTLRDAALEGANFASFNPRDPLNPSVINPEIATRVKSYSTTPIDLSSATVVVTPTSPPSALCASLAGASTPNTINIKATLIFNVSTPLIGAFIGQTIPISANVSTVILEPSC